MALSNTLILPYANNLKWISQGKKYTSIFQFECQSFFVFLSSWCIISICSLIDYSFICTRMNTFKVPPKWYFRNTLLVKISSFNKLLENRDLGVTKLWGIKVGGPIFLEIPWDKLDYKLAGRGFSIIWKKNFAICKWKLKWNRKKFDWRRTLALYH